MAEASTSRSAAVTMIRGSEPASSSSRHQTTPGLGHSEDSEQSMSAGRSDELPTVPPASEVVTGGFDPPLLLAAPPPARDISGTLLLDRYRLLKKLGEGGMGTVYLAEHVTIKKRCAIKLLNPEYAHKQDLVERFLQEARAASMIAHENVVEITDFGAAPNGSVFFVMEMLIGEDLAETIKRDAPLPWTRVAPIALQICRALGAAHGKGIIHRDMKPENCFRVERHGNPDFIKVLDFGIAKVTSDDPDGNAGRLTSTGMIFGTPTYMSPEQAQGEKVDQRSDIYALGVILYELLTGKVPFSADNFMGILTKHMFDEPPAPSEAAPHANISPEIEALVLKALQKERKFRFQTMDELAAAITAIGTGAEPVTVIPEQRARPISEGRPTAFLSRSGTGPIIRSSGEVTLAQPRRGRNRGLFVAMVAGFALLGGSAAALMALGDDPPQQPAPVVAAPVEAAPQVREPVTVVEPVATTTSTTTPTPTPPIAADARVYVISNATGAEVIDAATGAVLGASGEAGFTLPLSGGPRRALVRANGFEELELELAPEPDRRFDAQLKPKKKTAALKGKSGEGKVKPVEPKPPETTKPPETKQLGSMGLKNPFETRSTPP
jgi:serine/threonine protein kinase